MNKIQWISRNDGYGFKINVYIQVVCINDIFYSSIVYSGQLPKYVGNATTQEQAYNLALDLINKKHPEKISFHEFS